MHVLKEKNYFFLSFEYFEGNFYSQVSIIQIYSGNYYIHLKKLTMHQFKYYCVKSILKRNCKKTIKEIDNVFL